MMRSILLRATAVPILGLALLAGAPAQTQGDAKVDDPWVRPTVAAQRTTGAFMRIASAGGARLVGVSSPVAGHAELHEMRMDGNVMRMRPVPYIEVPAGKVAELKPGGFHVMLFELKQPVQEGQAVPLILEFEDGRKQRFSLQVQAKARMAAAAAHPPGHAH
jgi:copper(I)-binding protein